VHGTVQFTSEYFLRAAGYAADRGARLALAHSHPLGHGRQGLSPEDRDTERSLAAQTLVLTGHPLVGLTRAGLDGGYGARIWQRSAPHTYTPTDALSVRAVGTRLSVTWNDQLVPRPLPSAAQIRTVSAWGPAAQADLARMHVGVVGTGSVGMHIVEALARTGIARLSLFEFDSVEEHNLDRMLHATPEDARRHRAKVDLAAEAARRAATAADFTVTAHEYSIVEEPGFAAAADCDVLFSCVDRPWARAALNLLAMAHLVPVVDGGIEVDARGGKLRGADWRAHIAAPGRACLECLGQYDPGDVAVERDGSLDDPTYMSGLPADHRLRRRENVYVLSIAAAAAMLQQFITMTIAPSGIADTGAHLYHLTTGTIDHDNRNCRPNCLYSRDLLAHGDDTGLTVTGYHDAAEHARATRAANRSIPSVYSSSAHRTPPLTSADEVIDKSNLGLPGQGGAAVLDGSPKGSRSSRG
jgi:hypothetical protein